MEIAPIQHAASGWQLPLGTVTRRIFDRYSSATKTSSSSIGRETNADRMRYICTYMYNACDFCEILAHHLDKTSNIIAFDVFYCRRRVPHIARMRRTRDGATMGFQSIGWTSLWLVVGLMVSTQCICIYALFGAAYTTMTTVARRKLSALGAVKLRVLCCSNCSDHVASR